MNEPKRAAADAAWDEYAALGMAMQANPALSLDRAHVEELLIAFAKFRDAFLDGGE